MPNLAHEQQQPQEIVATLSEKSDAINTEILSFISEMVDELFGEQD